MHVASSPLRAFRSAVFACTALLTAASARAYVLSGNAWPSGKIPMLLQLDVTKPATVTLPLTDGSATWNAMAAQIFNDWNAAVTRTQFTSSESTSTAAVYGNRINNVLFSSTIYGDPFTSRTLAITLSTSTAVRKAESDVLVNSAFTWNSYRGAVRAGASDLRRVLLHEFGHVLGLGHPDQAEPAQSIAAVMNSTSGNTETLQLDDTNGAAFLYGTAITKSTITTQPANTTVSVTGTATISVAVDGQTAITENALHGYSWYFAPAGSSTFEQLFTIHNSTKLGFPLAQLADAGRYYFSAITPDDTVNSATVTLTVNPIALSPTTQLANVATRGVAGSGTNTMIVGFVITGTKSKQVILRAIGPSLSGFGVAGVLADPILTLKNSSGTDVALNDNWEQQTGTLSTVTAADIRAASARVGAFPLADGSKDAVIFPTLAPGGYTALVSGSTSASGVVLLEAYDADDPLDPAIKLANLSTRGAVGTGANIIIAGFVVTGPGPKTYLIRAIGPTLAEAPFNLPGALLDPFLKLYRGDGTFLRENDDWDSPAASQLAIRAAAARVGAFALLEKRNPVTRSGLDAVMLVTLPPGAYSAQMSGLDDATGIALIEVYEVPN